MTPNETVPSQYFHHATGDFLANMIPAIRAPRELTYNVLVIGFKLMPFPALKDQFAIPSCARASQNSAPIFLGNLPKSRHTTTFVDLFSCTSWTPRTATNRVKRSSPYMPLFAAPTVAMLGCQKSLRLEATASRPCKRYGIVKGKAFSGHHSRTKSLSGDRPTVEKVDATAASLSSEA